MNQDDLIDGNYSTCSNPVETIKLDLPSSSVWIKTVIVCTFDSGKLDLNNLIIFK